MIYAAEALVKNKKQRFNVEFKEDRILVNETIHNEILIEDIADIEVVNSKKVKIHLAGHKGEEIMNINRIRPDLRERFKETLLSLRNHAKVAS